MGSIGQSTSWRAIKTIGKYAGRALYPYARSAVKYGAGPVLAHAAHRYRNRGKSVGRNVSGVGVTVQRDRAVTYRRRRAPRRLRRRMRRSMRSFKSKILKMKGTRQAMNNSVYTVSSVASQQSVCTWVLYGGRVDGAVSTAVQRGYDDMNDIRRKDFLLGDATGDAQFRWAPGDVKWFVKTAVMDLTIQNTTAAQFALELDVYEFTCGIFQNDAGDSVEAALAYYNQDTYIPGGAANWTTIDLTDRGATPFELGPAMQKIRMKILKKTKYFIPYGDTVTYQIRDTRIRTFTHAVYRNNACTTKHTRGVMIIAKPVVASGDQIGTYQVGCTRKYKYVVDSSATSRAGNFEPIA